MAQCNRCGRYIKAKYHKATGLCYKCYSGKNISRGWSASGPRMRGCCTLGLIPTALLFLPFMTVYPNQKVLLSIIDLHNKKSSPILNKLNFKCRFTPTCSEYSRIAIQKYGVFKGGAKSLWRIARCNSFNKNKWYDYP